MALSFVCMPSWAQTEEPHKLDFQDSVRVTLENTKAIDASSIGASFSGAWINLGPDQQLMIKKQARMMKKKGYRSNAKTPSAAHCSGCP